MRFFSKHQDFSKSAISVIALVNCLANSVLAFTPPPVFENTVLSRTIDITGSYVRETVSITIKNVADKPEYIYYFALGPDSFTKIAVFEGRERRSNKGSLLTITPSTKTNDEENVNFYEIELSTPLKPHEESVIQFGIAFVDQIAPSPEYASQSDSQLLSYDGSRFTLSAYPSISQTLKVNTVGFNSEDLTAEDFQADEDNKEEGEEKYNLLPESEATALTYGPFTNVKPYSVSPMIVRYEYPRAVLKTTKLQRDIWISHWGATISFEESYQLHHFGTKLKDNSFSRLEFNKRSPDYNLNIASFKGMEIMLPENAREPYYTDLVGNVSTSHFRKSHDGSSLTLKPRYPLFGGWNYNFTIGWSVDLDEYVKTLEPDTYLLKVPLLQGPEEMPYDEVVINIVLPEGSTGIDIATLHPSQPETLFFTKSYLDFAGRPSLQLVYNNLIDSYRRTFVFVTYKYTPQAAFSKPLVLSGVFATLFTSILFLSKIDLSVSSFKPKKA